GHHLWVLPQGQGAVVYLEVARETRRSLQDKGVVPAVALYGQSAWQGHGVPDVGHFPGTPAECASDEDVVLAVVSEVRDKRLGEPSAIHAPVGIAGRVDQPIDAAKCGGQQNVVLLAISSSGGVQDHVLNSPTG